MPLSGTASYAPATEVYVPGRPVIVIGGVEDAAAAMTMLIDLPAVCPLESFTVSVKVYEPSVVGEPLRVPVLKVRPGGNVPAVWNQV